MIEPLNLPVNFTRTKSSSSPPKHQGIKSWKYLKVPFDLLHVFMPGLELHHQNLSPFAGRRLLVDRRLSHNIGLAGVGRCVTTVVGDWCGYGVIKL
jgi:hypothetical protein